MEIMNSSNMVKENDIREKFRVLAKNCAISTSKINVDKVTKAFEAAVEILEMKTWESNVPIILHSISVAQIIVDEIGLSTDSVVAALLHNVFESGAEKDDLIAQIPELFGDSVTSMLDGLVKINSIDTVNISVHSENFRRLIMALSGDLRVIMIKIADRLEDMRNLETLPSDLQMKYANESSYLYAPLAHRLGLYSIKTELEDTSLKYLRPTEYQTIFDKLEKTSEERSKFVSEFVKPIENKLKERSIAFEMKARTKSIYSIWNKMRKTNVPFEEVFDLFAIRVILDSQPQNEKSDCWQVYSIVTEEYQTNPERLRDWISIPKSNGYESLHTTVLVENERWVEIQIRTKRMDEIAERGLAAHWKYKGGKESANIEQWLTSIRGIIENSSLDEIDLIDEFRKNVYEDEIYVFTPKGDLKKLSAGATLLDFAYEIHSDVGDKCVGGKVNGRKVTIKHVLKNGDQISIDTSNNQRPKIDWLDFVTTSKAKGRIKSSLNLHKKVEADNGREIVKRKFKNWKLDYNDEVIRLLMSHFKLKTAQDLFYKVSLGDIEPLELKSIILKDDTESTTKDKDILHELLPKKVVNNLVFESGDEFLIIDNDLRNVIYKLAKCCNPIFGDQIFGFVTIREGIKIHRSNCPNATQMAERYPYRFIKAKWQNTKQHNSFQALVHLTGIDRPGIVTDISHIIAKDVGVQMRSINVDTKNGNFEGALRVFVNNVEHLDFLINKLKNIKGIQHVSRGD